MKHLTETSAPLSGNDNQGEDKFVRRGTLIFTVVVAVLVIVYACKKYSDGPMFSMRSRTERIANNWKVSQAFDKGIDVTHDFSKYELDLTPRGEAYLSSKYSFIGIDFDFETSGTWRFTTNDENVFLDFDNNDADMLYKIVRLKDDELWLIDEAGILELHFISK